MHSERVTTCTAWHIVRAFCKYFRVMWKRSLSCSYLVSGAKDFVLGSMGPMQMNVMMTSTQFHVPALGKKMCAIWVVRLSRCMLSFSFLKTPISLPFLLVCLLYLLKRQINCNYLHRNVLILKTVTERRGPHTLLPFRLKLMERARCGASYHIPDIVKQELKEKSFNFFCHEFDEGENICFRILIASVRAMRDEWK